MKKGKKKLKGMTLIEMIITIAVLAMLCVILAMVGANIDVTTRATNNLKDKIVKESPYAANRGKSFYDRDNQPVEFATELGTISISIDGHFDFGEDSYPDPKVDLDIIKYDTEQIALDGRSAAERKVILEGPNSGINFRFIDFPTPEDESDEEPAEEPAE